METLVIGGTGAVGSRVVEMLRPSGWGVRALTTSPEKAERMPEGVVGIVGNLAEEDTLGPAFEGVSRVFMVMPHALDETEMGLNAVRTARDAGVDRFVLMTAFRIEEAPHLPMFQTKIPVQNALQESGMRWTILQPCLFFQNDLLARDAIVERGMYPFPIGDEGASRVDARDIAEAAVHALTQDGHEGRVYPLVGSDAITGEEAARLWGEALGRPVHAAGSNLDAWASQARLAMPSWLVYDLRSLYQFIQEEGWLATDEDLEQQAAILARPPRRYADFVSETALRWRTGG